MHRSLGEIPALSGVVFFAVSPAAISASTEVRQYGLLLLFLCSALYATELSFQKQSTKWAIVQTALLLGGVLTHYIAIVAIVAFDLYVVLRCYSYRVPRRILLSFAAGQSFVLSIVAIFYSRQVRHSRTFSASGISYLDSYFHVKGSETFLGYMWRSLIETFQRMIGGSNRVLGCAVLVVFLMGIGALLAQLRRSRQLTALFMISPFALGFLAGVARVFPFAGSRHEAYLLPYFATGIAAALLWMPRRAGALVLLLEIAFAPLWALRTAPDNDLQIRPISDMRAAVNDIQQNVPTSAPLFVDLETLLELEYYMGRNDPTLDSSYEMAISTTINGHRIILPGGFEWSFSPQNVLAQVGQSRQQMGIPSAQPNWIVSVRWPGTVPLSSLLSAQPVATTHAFGTVSVFATAGQH